MTELDVLKRDMTDREIIQSVQDVCKSLKRRQIRLIIDICLETLDVRTRMEKLKEKQARIETLKSEMKK